jgi:hypothetical protein
VKTGLKALAAQTQLSAYFIVTDENYQEFRQVLYQPSQG